MCDFSIVFPCLDPQKYVNYNIICPGKSQLISVAIVTQVDGMGGVPVNPLQVGGRDGWASMSGTHTGVKLYAPPPVPSSPVSVYRGRPGRPSTTSPSRTRYFFHVLCVKPCHLGLAIVNLLI